MENGALGAMRGPLPKISDYVPGRWSATPPRRAGVYLMRLADGHSWGGVLGSEGVEPKTGRDAGERGDRVFLPRRRRGGGADEVG